MKKKKVIIPCIIVIIILITSFAVYAASIKIEYDYNITLDAPSFDLTGKTNDKNIDLANSTFDVLTKENDVFKVFKNQPKVEQNKVIKVYPHKVTYKTGEIVIYDNEFVESFTELKLAGYSKYYNNLFDYLVNKDSIMYSARIIIIGDINIAEETTITRPVSIEIADGASLTLTNSMYLYNSHPGNYYFKANKGAIIKENDSKIEIKAPKALYDLDINDQEKPLFSIESINEFSLNDASSFILNYLPDYLVENIYLPKTYMTSNITFDYGNFTGDISELNGNETITITITKENEQQIVDKDIIFNNTDDSLGLVLEKELSQANGFKDYNLLKLLKDLHVKRNITFNISDGAYFVVNNETSLNEIAITYTDNKYNLTLDDASVEINTLDIRRKMQEAQEFIITINDNETNINLSYPTMIEKIEYLKEYAHTYVITKDNQYNVIYNSDNKTYCGNEIIFDGKLFNNLNFKILDSENNEIEYTNTDGIISISNISNNYNNCYLIYYDNTKELFKVPLIKSLNSTSGEDIDFESKNPFDGLFTEETNWLENNSFDMPNDSSYENQYARISIISINGENYNYNNHTEKITIRKQDYTVKTHNMIRVVGSEENKTYVTAKDGTKYYRNINIEINSDYIPITNTIVNIMCELYNNGASEVVATHRYSFTIPGILKYGNTTTQDNKSPYVFVDEDFYNALITYFKNENQNEYYRDVDNKTYLLANIKYITKFDPKLKLDKKNVDISGIEMLTHTNEIILDNLKVKSLSPFQYFNSINLKKLSLNNCGINENMLRNYLYGIELESLSLNNNKFGLTFTGFDGAFFRTIKYLSIENSNLGTIDGLENVIYLEELHIANNLIKNIEVLKKMQYLKKVFLYNNNADNTLYGTNGLVNNCVYYWVMKTNNTEIYLNENTPLDSNYFNGIEDQILVLNAIVMSTVINDAEKAKIEANFNNYIINISSLDGTAIYLRISIVSFQEGKLILKCEIGTSANTFSTENITYREFYYS